MAEGRSTTGQDLAIISNRAKGDQFSFSSTSVVIVGIKIGVVILYGHHFNFRLFKGVFVSVLGEGSFSLHCFCVYSIVNN